MKTTTVQTDPRLPELCRHPTQPPANFYPFLTCPAQRGNLSYSCLALAPGKLTPFSLECSHSVLGPPHLRHVEQCLPCIFPVSILFYFVRWFRFLLFCLGEGCGQRPVHQAPDRWSRSLTVEVSRVAVARTRVANFCEVLHHVLRSPQVDRDAGCHQKDQVK